ncbi:MAG: glycosyltransferase family 4 protein [Candidatus Acidiferrales bacterium]
MLFVTLQPIGERRAGPAIRCWELAREVARRHEVTVASLQPSDLRDERVRVLADIPARRREFSAAARACDILVAQGPVFDFFPFLLRLGKYVIIDLYDPYLLENLSYSRPLERLRYLRQLHLLNQQLLRGDFFLCASERQRDYWLGQLQAVGRLNPDHHRLDPSLRNLLEVVSFGISPEPPQHTKPALRGVVPGIGPGDFLLLWAGGLWEWFDPLTILRALAEVSTELPAVRLVFLGTRHPNPRTPEMPILAQTRQLARDLGLLDRVVFFNEGWVPFAERQNYLLEADVGLSAHRETLEMRLAFRTRVLDYIWAGLPMILTAGDHFGDWAEQEQTGLTVPPGDVRGWKQAILRLARDPDLRQRFRSRLRELAPAFHWSKLAEPLVHYCDRPHHTPQSSRWLRLVLPPLVFAYRQWMNLRQGVLRLWGKDTP